MWASGHSAATVKRATHGYEPTREAAMAAFAKSWRRDRSPCVVAATKRTFVQKMHGTCDRDHTCGRRKRWYYMHIEYLLREERKMNRHHLAELRLQTGYIFENGSPFYKKLGEERAAALLRALRAEGYRIVPERDLSTRWISK
jgi:hypothetical protein